MNKLYILNVEELNNKARQDMILAGLNLKRQEKVQKCRREGDRLRSLAAGALLQYGIGQRQQSGMAHRRQEETGGGSFVPEYVAWSHLETFFAQPTSDLNLREDAHGKPYLEGNSLHFNLSHSGNIVVCAVSDREVGVDVQESVPVSHEKLWERFFEEREKVLLRGCESDEEREALFYRLWVQKEAYGKLTGEGIPEGLKVSPGADRAKLGICVEEFVPAPGYYGAVCRYAAD